LLNSKICYELAVTFETSKGSPKESPDLEAEEQTGPGGSGESFEKRPGDQGLIC